jgi:hypothetical protein
VCLATCTQCLATCTHSEGLRAWLLVHIPTSCVPGNLYEFRSPVCLATCTYSEGLLSLLQETKLLTAKSILALAGSRSSSTVLTWGEDLVEISLSANYTTLVSSKPQKHLEITHVACCCKLICLLVSLCSWVDYIFFLIIGFCILLRVILIINNTLSIVAKQKVLLFTINYYILLNSCCHSVHFEFCLLLSKYLVRNISNVELHHSEIFSCGASLPFRRQDSCVAAGVHKAKLSSNMENLWNVHSPNPP